MTTPDKQEVVEIVANGAGFRAEIIPTDKGFVLGYISTEKLSGLTLIRMPISKFFHFEGIKPAP
jgi:hypothetical protein